MRDIEDILHAYFEVHVVYFSLYNGEARIIKTEINVHPEFYFEKDGDTFFAAPFLFAQACLGVDKAYIYVWVFPEKDQDEYIKFKQFIETVKPSDFKMESDDNG